jgi:hypothetical protein
MLAMNLPDPPPLVVAEKQKIVGCACDGFHVARRDHFIEIRAEKAFLCDKHSPTIGATWSSIYGPQITHCPFCGSLLTNLKGS